VCFVYCSFADQLSASARQVKCYIDSDLSAVVGTTYHDLRQFVEAIDISTYFECSFSGRQPGDVSPFHLYEENLSNIARQLSGVLFNVFVILTFVGWFVGQALLLNKLQTNFSTVLGSIFVAFFFW